MARSLTPKQEKFAQVYIETGNASEAYRQAYNAGNMSANAIHVAANELMSNPKLSLRVNQLRAELKERHEVTVDSIVKELEQARAVSMAKDQGAAMVSASMGKAKLMGLITDRQLHGEDKDNPLPTKVMVSFGNDT